MRLHARRSCAGVTPWRHAGGLDGLGAAREQFGKPALSATVGGGHALWKARASAADGAEVTLALVVRAGRAPNDLKVQRRMGVHKLRVGPAPRTPTHTSSHACAAHTHRHMPAGHCAVWEYHAAWDTTPHGIPCRMGYRAAWDTTPHGIPRCIGSHACSGRSRSRCRPQPAGLRRCKAARMCSSTSRLDRCPPVCAVQRNIQRCVQRNIQRCVQRNIQRQHAALPPTGHAAAVAAP